MRTLGTTIRRLREEAGLTQEELAKRLGISPSHVSHMERDRRHPSLQLLRRLANELSVWPGLLLGALVQTEMPDELQAVFEEFVERLLETMHATQLSLPLEADEFRGAKSVEELTLR